MRIGRLFAVSMLSVTVLAVVLGAGVLVPQYRTFASKSEAIKTVEAYGAVLAASSFLYVAMADLIPGLHRGKTDASSLRQILFIGAGIVTAIVVQFLV